MPQPPARVRRASISFSYCSLLDSPGRNPATGAASSTGAADYMESRRRGLDAFEQSRGNGCLDAPREVDPAVGAPPDVLAAHGRPRLLVEDGAARLRHFPPQGLLHQTQRP